MLRNLFAKTLRDDRRSLLWWGGITALLAFLITLLYPTYRDQAATFEEFWKDAPAIMRAFFGEEFDFGSPEGFLSAEVYATMAPLIFAIFAIGAGSRAIAGEEQEGTLEILLAQPLPRHRIVLHKFAAMATTSLLLAAALALSVLAGSVVVGMEIDAARLFGATLLTAMLGLTFGSLALLTGAALRGKGRAIGIATGLAVATFLLNGLAPLVSWLEPFRVLSPWYWFTRSAPLQNGLAAADVLVLSAIVLAAVGLATVAFERRDVAT